MVLAVVPGAGQQGPQETSAIHMEGSLKHQHAYSCVQKAWNADTHLAGRYDEAAGQAMAEKDLRPALLDTVQVDASILAYQSFLRTSLLSLMRGYLRYVQAVRCVRSGTIQKSRRLSESRHALG